MSDFSRLRAIIDANIKQNGVEAITGDILNNVLNEMVDELGDEITAAQSKDVFLTEAQYDALETKDPNKVYYIYEE